jgi:hypothetical protein
MDQRPSGIVDLLRVERPASEPALRRQKSKNLIRPSGKPENFSGIHATALNDNIGCRFQASDIIHVAVVVASPIGFCRAPASATGIASASIAPINAGCNGDRRYGGSWGPTVSR